MKEYQEDLDQRPFFTPLPEYKMGEDCFKELREKGVQNVEELLERLPRPSKRVKLKHGPAYGHF